MISSSVLHIIDETSLVATPGSLYNATRYKIRMSMVQDTIPLINRYSMICYNTVPYTMPQAA